MKFNFYPFKKINQKIEHFSKNHNIIFNQKIMKLIYEKKILLNYFTCYNNG